MCKACCLKKGETLDTVSKETLYRRYLRFYLGFHIIYSIGTLIEYILLYGEYWSVSYLLSFIFLVIDCMMISGLLLRPEKGPDRRVVYMAVIMTSITLLLYTISRMFAFASPHVDAVYSGFVIIFLLVFVFIKARCLYHIYRFNRFNSFEKNTHRLSQNDPIEINEESWSRKNTQDDDHNGITNYVTMQDEDGDGIGVIPIDSVGSPPKSFRSNNSSLDLGNVNIHNSMDSQHSFRSIE